MAEHSTVALIGSDSLLGREIRDLLSESNPGFHLRLISSGDEESGTLTRVGDEPTLVSGLTSEALEGASIAILGGTPESNRKALELADSAVIVDLTGIAEEQPEARLRAPLAEPPDASQEEARVHVIAHPAAIALALFLRRLHLHEPIARSVVQIFAPASAHGTRGIEELQQQTVSLLSFKALPKTIFDAQLGFNLLPRYGEQAPASLEDSELRIERHLATLLALEGEGEGVPMPSLRLIQVPVFHGYSICAWVEFENDPDPASLEEALLSGAIEVRGEDVEAPTNVGQAGQGGIAVGAISPDRNHAAACWFWLVADNLRLSAENALAVVRQIV